MKLTTMAVAGTAATLASLALTAAATASTDGCMTARFTCGDLVPAVQGMASARPGWSVTADAPGAPLVIAPDLASSPASDFRVSTEGTGGVGRVFEYAPRGRLSGLCVSPNVTGPYRYGRVVVKPGVLVLAGCDHDWAQRWMAVPVPSGGQEYINDLTGDVIAPAGAGREVPTVDATKVSMRAVAWAFQGNGGN